jgi:hypothetical protein
MCIIYTVQRTSNFFLCLLHSCNVLFGMFYYQLWLPICTFCIVFILHIKCRVALRPQEIIEEEKEYYSKIDSYMYLSIPRFHSWK